MLEDSIIYRIFGGHFRRRIRSQNRDSMAFEPFTILDLDINTANSIVDASTTLLVVNSGGRCTGRSFDAFTVSQTLSIAAELGQSYALDDLILGYRSAVLWWPVLRRFFCDDCHSIDTSATAPSATSHSLSGASIDRRLH